MAGGPTGGGREPRLGRPDDVLDGGADWVRPLPPGLGPRAGPRGRSGGRPPGRRRRGGRPLELPPRLPTVPVLLVALAAVALAFLLGRATGGDGEVETATTVSQATSSTTTTTAAVTEHTVERGETLAAIAARFGVTPQQIAEANDIADPNHLEVGQVLQIPPRVP